MYGFADAPLMFQLALVDFLKQRGATPSHFDDSYLYWYSTINNRQGLVSVSYTHLTLPTIFRV